MDDIKLPLLFRNFINDQLAFILFMSRYKTTLRLSYHLFVQYPNEAQSSSELIDVFACSTFDLLAANRELKHDSAILALFLADLGRRHLVDCLAAGALDLLWAGNKL